MQGNGRCIIEGKRNHFWPRALLSFACIAYFISDLPSHFSRSKGKPFSEPPTSKNKL